ncbi:MAG TPA: helix-turn-helix transcriptional regulator [Devosiaceae bacterium]|nr:helix-turn-helix transcriptional regulator [Devosiaceae bacterium]
MVSHRSIWDAIDGLAERRGVSASALARLAGLDPTALNPSKRVSKEGRPRWPSTESIAKVLDATGEEFDAFLSGGGGLQSRSVPLLGFAQAGSGGYFDSSGFPVGQGWDRVELPGSADSGTYALEVSGESMLPLYRDGDTLIVSPAERARRGDRVVVKTLDGEVMAKVLFRRTADNLELHSLNPKHPPRTLPLREVEWIARILWASQ